MNKLLLIAGVLTLSSLLTSCGNDDIKDGNTPEEVVEETFVDNANAEFTAADTSSTGVYQEEVEETKETSLQNALKNEHQSEVIKESGMSFCDCVKKNKKINDLIMESDDDVVLDQAMADLEEMRTGECKILFEGKQNNIEEKQAHERRVKKCL